MNIPNIKTPTYLRLALAVFTFSLISLEKHSCSAGGITVITHGQGSDIDSWVSYMATRIDEYRFFPGSKATFYKVSVDFTNSAFVSSWQRLGGNDPLTSDSGEIVLLFDWRNLANTSYSTMQVAPLFASTLLSPAFIPELGGHAPAELPIHTIGHSRGGSLLSEVIKLLGTNGVWVDHQTTLDGYAFQNDAMLTNPYENVLFHDNYWQDNSLSIHGFARAGAYNRRLTALQGGYWPDYINDHSDVHLWYHGTIDWNTPANDGNASVSTVERLFWWTSAEERGTNAGFLYSLIGGGNRMNTAAPVHPDSGRIVDGFNQRWDLGAGTAVNNRQILPSVLSSWPNVIRLNITGPLSLGQGQSTTVQFYYQWAFGALETNATVSFYLDSDANPWNGNEAFITNTLVGTTTANQVGNRTVTLTVNLDHQPGTYRVLSKIQYGARSRYLYATERITVLGAPSPLRVAVGLEIDRRVRIDTFADVGNRIVLEASVNLFSWQPIATNVLQNSRWSVVENPSFSRRFYRAVQR